MWTVELYGWIDGWMENFAKATSYLIPRTILFSSDNFLSKMRNGFHLREEIFFALIYSEYRLGTWL